MTGSKFLDTLTPPTSLPGEAAVGEWLSELVQTLQSQLDMVASGAAMLPYAYLTKRYLAESVPLGATASFQHETNGTLTGRFVKLGAHNTTGFARPVGYRTNSTQLYEVTDRVSESSDALFAGLDISGPNETGEYGWILIGGVSPVSPELTGTVTHLAEIGWVADDSLATNAATTVGRLISNGADLQVLLNAQPSPVNDKTLIGSIDRLNRRLDQMRTELANKPDSGSLNQMLQNLVVTSITAVNQTVDLIQSQLQKIDSNLALVEVEQTLRAMADFRVELANAAQQADATRQQMHVTAQAALHSKESSKVWSDESGVHSEASAESAGRSAITAADSLLSAEASFAHSQTAETHMTAAGVSAAASEASRLAAEAANVSATAQASASASSAASASSSAATATTQATLSATFATDANRAINSVVPADFRRDGQYFSRFYNGSPESQTPIGAGDGQTTFTTVAGVGRVLELLTTGVYDVTNIGVLKVQPGRFYRVRATVRSLSGVRSFDLYAMTLDTAYNHVSISGNTNIYSATTTWQTRSFDLAGDTMIANGIAYLRGFLRAAADADFIQISELGVFDVTESTESAASASASSSSAASASASAATATSQATLSANAATASRLNLARLMPGTFDADGQYFFDGYQGDPATQSPLVPAGFFSFQTTTQGRVLQVDTSGARDFSQIGVIAVLPNRVYRARFRHRTLTGARTFVGVISTLDSSYTYVSTAGNQAGFASSTSWQVSDVILSGNTMLANGVAYIRAYAAVFADVDVMQFLEISCEDITVEAEVTTNSGAISTIQGAAAFHETIVAAGGGFPAVSRLKAGASGSTIDLAASKLTICNPSNTSQWQEVARFEGGVAKLNDAIIRKLQVGPRSDSTIFFPVQLKPKIYVGSDGQTVTYETGKTMGAAPERIVADLTGIPVGTGEALDVRATAVSATQFTVYAKKTTPSAPALQTTAAGTFVGGTPQVRTHKPTAADAYNGYYTFQFDATLALNYAEPDFGGMYMCAYSGMVDFYADSGSGWVKISTTELYFSEYVSGYPPATNNYANQTFTLSWPNVIGQHGSYEFGIHPGPGTSGLALDNVKYSTQTSGTVTALTQTIPFLVYTPPAD